MSSDIETRNEQCEFECSSLSKIFLRSFEWSNGEEFDTSVKSGNEFHHSIQFLEESVEDGLYDDEKLAASAGILVGFLDRLANSNEIRANEYTLLSEMLRPSFLRSLFKHRQTVLQVPLPDAVEAVVDWVELILFKLSEAVLHISGSPSTSVDVPEQRLPWSDILEFKMSPSKYISAASQLPTTWSDIYSCLNSTRISEAAKRLAICLLFGVYILSSYSAKARSEDHCDLAIFRKSLNEYLKCAGSNHYYEDQTSAKFLPHHIFQSQYSMLLILFSSLELEMEPIHDFPFHPSVIDGAMALIGQILLEPQELVLFEILTEEQVRLFRWDTLMLWCWRIWDIGLCWHERVLQMTATWLYHFVMNDSDLYGIFQSKFRNSHVSEILLTLIDVISLSNAGEPIRSVLFKACWAFCYLFEKDSPIFNDVMLQKTLQVFFRLLTTLEYEVLDEPIRDLAFQIILKTTWNPILVTDDTTRIILGVVQRVRCICNGGDAATSLDQATLTTYLGVLIFAFHNNFFIKSPEVADKVFLSRVASFIENPLWSTAVQLNALLLLSYPPKINEILYSRLLSTMLKRARSCDPLFAGVLAASLYKVESVLPALDPYLVLELWYYLSSTFLLYSNSKTTEDLRDILNTIACGLTCLISLTPLPQNPAWLTSPWTATLHRDLISQAQLPGAQALLEQLRKTMTGDSGVSKRVFTQRLSVVYIQGNSQLMNIIE